MRVLMSSPSVRIPDKVAQSIHQMEFYRNLVEMGHEVDIVAMRGEGQTDIEIQDIFSRDVPLQRLFFNADTRKRLDRLLKERDYDLVHDRGYLFGGIGTVMAEKNGMPSVLQIDDDWIEMERRNARYLKVPFLLGKARKGCVEMIARATKGFTVSRKLKEIVRDSWGADVSNLEVVPNGVDTELFRPTGPDMEMCERLGLGERTMVFVGALGPWHGIDVLLEAVPMIQDKVDGFKVLVVGGKESDVRAYARTAVKDVIFTGRVPYEDVARYINLADLCVAPYPDIDYGFSPFKILEYMACGRPVICSDLGSLREIVTQDTAILFKAGDPKALAEGTIRAFGMGLEDMGKRARQVVLEDFTWRRSTERLVQLYEKALGTR